MNSRHIPAHLETEILHRDTHCVYCGILFDTTRSHTASREHITNDATIITRENEGVEDDRCNGVRCDVLGLTVGRCQSVGKCFGSFTRIACNTTTCLHNPPSRGEIRHLQEPLR